MILVLAAFIRRSRTVAAVGLTTKVQLQPNEIERAKRAHTSAAVNCNLLLAGPWDTVEEIDHARFQRIFRSHNQESCALDQLL